MSLAASKAQLQTLTRNLQAAWGQTRERWRDQRGEDFQARYLEPLEQHVNAALVAIEKLESVLHKVRNDCE
jgi:uncharacterized protein YukE